MPTQSQVLLYAPNVVGYFRLGLLVAGVGVACVSSNFELCWWLFFVNFILDGVDGALARRLNQTSSFGAFLDVIVDNASRGVLWTWAVPGPFGVLPPLMEMLTFVCTHKASGAQWRTGFFANAPWWVQMVMKNGFKTPPGIVAVIGLMGCPLWVWALKHLPNTVYSSLWVGAVTVAGRLLAFSVELWVLKRYMAMLLKEDSR
eukprot:evm.model.scf_181EXC.6 EVM.evm.TU.scf_181EXC.6   scf_181EXC:25269-27852(-)